MKTLNGWKWALQKIVAMSGSKNALATGVSVKEEVGATQQLTLTLVNQRVATTDAGANGAQGGLKVFTLPQGDITILGATANLSIAREGAGIAANSTVLTSVGTTLVAAGEATLSGTEADLIPSTTTALSSGTATPKNRLTALAKFDGTTTAKDVFLNFNVDATGSTANDAIIANGTITISYVHHGDY